MFSLFQFVQLSCIAWFIKIYLIQFLLIFSMEFNFIKLVFGFITIHVSICSFLIQLNEDILPLFVKRIFRYGKYAEKADHKIVKKFELPKRCFKHFYAFAAPLSSAALLIAVNRYLFNKKLPGIVYKLLDLLLGSSRNALVSSEATIIATILITVHCWKRYHETHSISVFSNAKINLGHYIAGFVHYIGAVTCIIGESNGFIKDTSNNFQWHKISNLQLFCAVIFLIASYEQLKTNLILANLRKNKEGKVVTNSYRLPVGRLFNYISSPLQFTEIIMYMMLSIILWRSSSFHYITLWVIANQISTALLDHQWYKKTYKEHSKSRKIIIPFLV